MEDILLTFNNYQILKVALILIAFGICLPTFDTYTDVGLSYSFFTGTYCMWDYGKDEWVCSENEKYPIYGWMLLVPIFLVTFFTSFHWWKRENTTRKRILTFPLLIGQLWPQWQVMKILWMMKKKNGHWKAEREKLQKEVGSLGNTYMCVWSTEF